MTAERLAELPESAATGQMADLYADIRAVLGLPMVNLVYRNLATRPGVLEKCWAQLRPNYASATAASAGRELVALAAPEGVAALPRATVEAVGLTGEQARLGLATLAAYRRSNSLNILGMFALLDGCPGGGSAETAPPPEPVPILPMAPLAGMDPATAELLDEMSLRTIGGDEPRIVPSLLRHFAHSHRLLALLWTVIEPGAGESTRRAPVIASRARELAQGLPGRVPKL